MKDLPMELWPLAEKMESIGEKSPAFKQFPEILDVLADHQRRINQIGVAIKAAESRLELRTRIASNGRYTS